MAKLKIPRRRSSIAYLHNDFDSCIKCRYLMMTIQVGDFLDLVQPAFSFQGAIEGQRDVVRTATATRIRRRMADDLRKGAIVPPIVLGAVVPQSTIDQSDWDTRSIQGLVAGLGREGLSLIDGMQRTHVFYENRDELAEKYVRIELWLAPSTENLVYRMLILNTGQIPWNLRRQLEVIHKSLIDEIRTSLKGDLEIYRTDDKRRRTTAGEFQGNEIIEMYLAFNLRKPHVDKESVLADQFSKLDLIEAVSRPDGLEEFVGAMRCLILLDRQFSRAKDERAKPMDKLRSGRHIFDKVSACAGFMSAYAQLAFGKVGMDREVAARGSALKKIKANCKALAKNLSEMSPAELCGFLALDTLREVSERRAGALSIGEAERELFLSSFRLLLEEGAALSSMEPCWRSQ